MEALGWSMRFGFHRRNCRKEPSVVLPLRTWAAVVVIWAVGHSLNIEVMVDAQRLSANFYGTSCPGLQVISRAAFTQAVVQNILAPASLLRLSFHDCIVDGCDGSVLLDSGKGGSDEKLSSLNLGIAGLEVIDIMKQATEQQCPGVVSCADLVILAASFAVATSGGPNIPVLLGRRDGLTSSTANANGQLLPPTSSVDRMLSAFGAVGLDTMHTVAILGSHTLGVGHCESIRNRLYPQLDATLQTQPFFAINLRSQCPLVGGSSATTVQNDLTNIIFDNQYFRNIMGGQGLFSIDAAMATDPRTSSFVAQFAGNSQLFFQVFTEAFTQLSQFKVLTGSQGQIRSSCRRPN